MKKIYSFLTLIFGISVFSFNMVNAQGNGGISIIPDGNTNNAGNIVSEINKGGKVWDNYRKKLKDGDMSLGEKFASGVMDRDTILDYCVYLIKFIGEIALLVGAMAIIVLGYKKATEHIKFGNNKIGRVIMGILVIIFAYVIVRAIWAMFIS